VCSFCARGAFESEKGEDFDGCDKRAAGMALCNESFILLAFDAISEV